MVFAPALNLHRHQAPTPPTFTSTTTGWSNFVPSPDTPPGSGTRVWYVSSSTGSDTMFDGSSPTNIGNGHGPFATIAHARQQLRSGYPDWLLLLKGDTWTAEYLQFGGGLTGGRGMTEPMLIGSYGIGARPKIITNADSGGPGNAIGFFNSPYANYVAIVGINLHSGSNGVTPNSTESYGIFGVGAHQNILIEDCKIELFAFNVAFVSANISQNLIIRRNVICDANHNGDTYAGQGIIIGESGQVLIEENCFLHNGFIPGQIALSGATWTESTKTLTKTGAFASYTWAGGDLLTISGGTGATVSTYDVASKASNDAIVLKTSIGAGANGHNDIAGTLLWVQCFNFNRHNGYLNDGQPNYIYRGNVISGTDGLQMRCGGLCQNNLSLCNAFAFQFGVGTLPERDPNGTQGLLSGNVAIDGGPDFSNSGGGGSEGGRGAAYILGNTNGVAARFNIACNNTTGTGPSPWILGFDNGHGGGVGCQNTTLDSNLVYGWSGSAGHGGNGAQSGGLLSFWENFGRTTNNNGVMQTALLLNLIVTNNDFQGTVDGSYLWNLDQNGQFGNVPLSQITSSGNRFYRASGNTAALFRGQDANGNGQDWSFAQFASAMHDGTSTNAQVTYTDPTKATISQFFSDLNGGAGANGVTPDGSVTSFINALRGQVRATWNRYIMPTYGASIPFTGIGLWNAYPAGYTGDPLTDGPLQYIRKKFATKYSAMGMTVTGCSPSTGTAGTPVHITGTGFLAYYNGQRVLGLLGNASIDTGTIANLTDTSFDCVAPAHAAGAVTITVHNGDGIATSAGNLFTYS